MTFAYRILFGFLFLILQTGAFAQNLPDLSAANIEVQYPQIIVKSVEQEIKIHITDRELAREMEAMPIHVRLNDNEYVLAVESGSVIILYDFPLKEELTISMGDLKHSKKVNPIPLWLSILPPLIAIMVALFIREF